MSAFDKQQLAPRTKEVAEATEPMLYLSNTRGVYADVLNGRRTICQSCPSLVLGLDGVLTLNGKTTRSFLVKAGTRMQLTAMKPCHVAIVLLDIGDIDYATVAGSMCAGTPALFHDYKYETALIHTITDALEGRVSITEMIKGLLRVISLPPQQKQMALIDAGVSGLLAFIRLNPAVELPLKSIAKVESMTIQALEARFYQATGLTIEAYQWWRRLFETIYHFRDGISLNKAIVKGGFHSTARFKQHLVIHFGKESLHLMHQRSNIVMNRFGKTL